MGIAAHATIIILNNETTTDPPTTAWAEVNYSEEDAWYMGTTWGKAKRHTGQTLAIEDNRYNYAVTGIERTWLTIFHDGDVFGRHDPPIEEEQESGRFTGDAAIMNSQNSNEIIARYVITKTTATRNTS